MIFSFQNLCLQVEYLIWDNLFCYWASLVAQMLKRLPGMRETWVWSLGREDPLEKEMATHSSTLAWRIPWREEPGRLQSMGSQESDTTERLSFLLPFVIAERKVIGFWTNFRSIIKFSITTVPLCSYIWLIKLCPVVPSHIL